jgi:hypothetical protein
MGTGLPPFVGAAACSYDLPLGTILHVENGEGLTVQAGDATFTVPRRLMCLDRFGRPTRGRRVDIVFLVPESPGRAELDLARNWGVRSLTVAVDLPERPWREMIASAEHELIAELGPAGDPRPPLSP